MSKELHGSSALPKILRAYFNRTGKHLSVTSQWGQGLKAIIIRIQSDLDNLEKGRKPMEFNKNKLANKFRKESKQIPKYSWRRWVITPQRKYKGECESMAQPLCSFARVMQKYINKNMCKPLNSIFPHS